jgi:hypothetical protein
MKLAKRKSQPLSPQQQLASEISQLWSQQLQEVENNPEALQERLRVLKSYLKDSGQNLHLSSNLFLDPDQLYQVFKNNDLLLQVNRRQLDQWLSQPRDHRDRRPHGCVVREGRHPHVCRIRFAGAR